MMDLYEKFAAVCRKWELPKDQGTLQLFRCYYDIAYFIHFGQYEANNYGFLESAQLIKLLKYGNGLKVTSAEGVEVALDNQMLIDFLYMHLNNDLQKMSAGQYAYINLTSEKGILKSGNVPDDVAFWWEGCSEPYTDKELQNIIEFEKTRKEYEGKLSPVKRLGHCVQRFLIEAPMVFGFFYCHVDDEGNKLKPNLSPTKQFNIIGDLLEAAGVLQEYKGQLWMEGKWENMNDSARRHEVQDWLKAYEKMEAKWWDETKPLFFPNSMIHLSGKKVLNQSQPAKIVQYGGRMLLEDEIIEERFSKLDF